MNEFIYWVEYGLESRCVWLSVSQTSDEWIPFGKKKKINPMSNSCVLCYHFCACICSQWVAFILTYIWLGNCRLRARNFWEQKRVRLWENVSTNNATNHQKKGAKTGGAMSGYFERVALSWHPPKIPEMARNGSFGDCRGSKRFLMELCMYL